LAKWGNVTGVNVSNLNNPPKVTVPSTVKRQSKC